MKRMLAFILGLIEFRSNITTNIGEQYIETYDTGQELAHMLTFRHCEQ